MENILKKEIVILTPFRVGSTSVREALSGIPNLSIHKLHTYGPYEYHIIKPDKVDGVILIYRKPIDIYISAYFADCDKPEYPYYFGTRDDVMAAPIDQLINHFKSFKWETYGWLNYDYYIDTLKKTFNVDPIGIKGFMDSPDHITHKVCVGKYHNQSKFMVVLLLKTNKLDQSMVIINNTFNIHIENMNRYQRQDQESWCSQKYVEFITKYDDII